MFNQFDVKEHNLFDTFECVFIIYIYIYIYYDPNLFMPNPDPLTLCWFHVEFVNCVKIDNPSFNANNYLVYIFAFPSPYRPGVVDLVTNLLSSVGY
jgi:hypothetical protein